MQAGNYDLATTENLTGTTGQTATATAKTYTGYHENTTHTGRVASGAIKADGSLVLKLYYARNDYTVTFEPHNGANIPNQTVKYQEKATKPTNPSKTGYTFKEWREVGKTTAFSFDTQITKNTDLEAIWNPVSYNIT